MKAYRDENFWNCWKGDEAKSGGLVYILGSHIFDLLLCAFDDNYDLVEANDSMKLSTGKIMFGETEVNFHLEFLDNREGQTRHILIDGEEFILSLRDNLSFEGLHDKVYEAFLNGTAPQLYDVKRSIILMDKIKKFKT
jgi:hypothetical protein